MGVSEISGTLFGSLLEGDPTTWGSVLGVLVNPKSVGKFRTQGQPCTAQSCLGPVYPVPLCRTGGVSETVRYCEGEESLK